MAKGFSSTESFGVAVFTSLAGVAATTTGATLDSGLVHNNVTLAVTLSFGAAPTAISTQLQGSLDNVNWFNLGAAQTSLVAGTTAVSATGSPAQFFRATTTITGGTAPVLTGLIAVA